MSNNMWEGLGGPVHMDQPDFGEIDPTLDACCRREVRAVFWLCVYVCIQRSKLTQSTSHIRWNRIARDQCWNRL